MTFWLAVLLVSMTLPMAADLFLRDAGLWQVMVVLAVALLWWPQRTVRFEIDRKWWTLSVPLALLGFTLGFPLSLGPLLLAGGLVGVCLSPAELRLRPLAAAVCLCGGILVLQSAMTPLYFHFAPRAEESPLLARTLCFALQQLGEPACAWTGPGILLPRAYDVLRLPASWEILGGAQLALLWLAVTAILVALRRDSRQILEATSGIFVWAVLRAIGLVAVYARSGSQLDGLFVEPWVTFVSFLPLVVFLAVRAPVSPPTSPVVARLAKVSAGAWIHVIALATCGVLVLCPVMIYDGGVGKQGKVVIDDYHGNWEWSTEPFDTKQFGKRAGYNFYGARWFLSHYYDVPVNQQPLSREVLDDCAVLILKCATKAFTDDECRYIEDFVHKGGGLLLIGDHTNVFGMTTYLNKVARRFGMAFRHDATYDLETLGATRYRTRGPLPHPIVQNLREVPFLTSCSLDANWSCQSVIVGRGVRCYEADFSGRSFFPGQKNLGEGRMGLVLQQAAARYGKGRISAFTDSTIFSNFAFFAPGRWELLLCTVDWLNRTNRAVLARLVVCLLGLVLGTVAVMRAIPRPVGVLFIGASALAWCLPASLVIAQHMNADAYPMPRPRQPYTLVAFESERSSANTGRRKGGDRQHGEPKILSESANYHTFFVNTQRLGIVPRVFLTVESAVQEADVLVVVNPNSDFSDRELTQVRAYVQRGGRLLVLDNPRNRYSSGSQVLAQFGLRFAYRVLDPHALRRPRQQRKAATKQTQSGVETQPPAFELIGKNGKELTKTPVPAIVTGGTAVVYARHEENLKPVLAYVTYGKGMVVAFGASDLFDSQRLGSVMAALTEDQRVVAEMEFWLFNSLRVGGFHPFALGQIIRERPSPGPEAP